jgi:hypothetical protein
MVTQSRLAFVALAAALLAGQQAVAAKNHPGVREQSRERQAKKACLSGDYPTGVSILADLFVETEDPVYLYNQGRCYEQNVRYVEAAERFREYLRKAGTPSDEIKADVDKHIADCEAGAARVQPRAVEGASPAAQPSTTPPPGYVAQTPNSPASPDVVQPSAAVSTDSSVEHPWQHTAKWVATGAAVAFLGLGVVEHVRYYTKNRDYNNDPGCAAGRCKDLANAADTAQIVSLVGYGAAAVATGLAITFWVTDKPPSQASKQAGIAVTCAPMLAGAACGGRF